MKKLIIIILLLLCLTANVSHSQSFKMFGQLLNLGHWSTEGLVFFWRGIEAVEVVDESYYGNDGTITGPTWVGQGLVFDGNEDRVTTSVAAILNPNVGTMIFDGIQGIGSTGRTTHDFWWDTWGGGNRRFITWITDTELLHVWTDSTQRGTIALPTWNKGDRIHAAVVWGENKFYLNGTLFHTFDSGGLGNGATTLYIGDRYTGADLAFTGTVTGFTIYNRALSASEIQQLYLNPNLPMQQDPIWLLQPSAVPSGIIPIIQAHARRRRAG